ncbi:MAG: AAA family ATPase [Acidimicrobiia bacterium]
MRPLELRLRDFRSHRGEDTVIDFRDRRLVGIVGPIGSGKSSILDAVAFALFGKTPSGGAATKALINQRADGATVQLRFEVEGEVWEAVRSLRRKGQSQHSLARLSEDVDGPTEEERVVQEGAVNERVVALLGLDFDAFSKSVLLAQGKFAEFLRARPGERDGVLKGVFGHDRIDGMRQAARDRMTSASAELATLTGRIEGLDRIAERAELRRIELAAAVERIEAMEKAEPRLLELAERSKTASLRMEEAARRAGELDEIAEKLPGTVMTEETVAAAVGASSARKRLAATLEQAQADLAVREAELAYALADGLQTRLEEAADRLAARDPEVRALAVARDRMTSLAKRIEQAVGDVDAKQSSVAESEAKAIASEQAATAARDLAAAAGAELHEARHVDMAQALRGRLEIGAPCPVCDQDVPTLPPAVPGSELEQLETAATNARVAAEAGSATHAEAVARLEAARTAAGAAQTLASSLRAEEAAAAGGVEEAQRRVAAIDEALASLLGDGDPAGSLADARARLGALTDSVTSARRTVDGCRREHDEAIRHEQNAVRDLSAIRVTLVDVAARLDASLPPATDDPASVATTLDALRAAHSERRDALAQERDVDRVTLEEASAEQAKLFAGLGLEEDFTAALAAERTRAELGAAQLAVDDAELAEGTHLRRQAEQLSERHALFERLAADLTDARFVRFLLDDERARLSELGSEHFQRLTSGRYRFTGDGTFKIVDLTAADAVRKADSLSGGETFLASLALALALAEMVSRIGGRLDAFFLDEGFGALDPEHLDLAMEGIESLAAGAASRLVVVVSHVPELRHRIEDLIELDRAPLTGDTVVVRR